MCVQRAKKPVAARVKVNSIGLKSAEGRQDVQADTTATGRPIAVEVAGRHTIIQLLGDLPVVAPGPTSTRVPESLQARLANLVMQQMSII